jgi:hypothetical protein
MFNRSTTPLLPVTVGYMSRFALQNVQITDKLNSKLAYIPCYK